MALAGTPPKVFLTARNPAYEMTGVRNTGTFDAPQLCPDDLRSLRSNTSRSILEQIQATSEVGPHAICTPQSNDTESQITHAKQNHHYEEVHDPSSKTCLLIATDHDTPPEPCPVVSTKQDSVSIGSSESTDDYTYPHTIKLVQSQGSSQTSLLPRIKVDQHQQASTLTSRPTPKQIEALAQGYSYQFDHDEIAHEHCGLSFIVPQTPVTNGCNTDKDGIQEKSDDSLGAYVEGESNGSSRVSTMRPSPELFGALAQGYSYQGDHDDLAPIPEQNIIRREEHQQSCAVVSNPGTMEHSAVEGVTLFHIGRPTPEQIEALGQGYSYQGDHDELISQPEEDLKLGKNEQYQQLCSTGSTTSSKLYQGSGTLLPKHQVPEGGHTQTFMPQPTTVTIQPESPGYSYHLGEELEENGHEEQRMDNSEAYNSYVKPQQSESLDAVPELTISRNHSVHPSVPLTTKSLRPTPQQMEALGEGYSYQFDHDELVTIQQRISRSNTIGASLAGCIDGYESGREPNPPGAQSHTVDEDVSRPITANSLRPTPEQVSIGYSYQYDHSEITMLPESDNGAEGV